MPRIYCLVGLLVITGCTASRRDQVISSPVSGTVVSTPSGATRSIARTASYQLPSGDPHDPRGIVESAPPYTPESSTPESYPNEMGLVETGLVEPVADIPLTDDSIPVAESAMDPAIDQLPSESLPLNLPTALAMVDRQHPAVGLAQWRVQQAYADLARANALWLPSIRAGFSFNRHDGNLQASDGQIVDVNRNSFQYGLGAGAVGAGTSSVPGLLAQFHMADAIFAPQVARSNAAAQSYSATAATNQQLMMAAITYLNLLGAHQDQRIIQETRDSTVDLVKLTGDFAITGKGLQADADRMETELALVENRLAIAQEQIGTEAARLAEAISADVGTMIVPMDPAVIPIDLVPVDRDRSTLIQIGLAHRPELCESQALVAAACQQFKRQKFAPLVPSVLLGFSTGGFGGGLGNNLDNVDGRYDFDAIVSWEVRNFGLGEAAARRASSAQIQQAKYAKLAVMDRVAREVAEAHAQVTQRARRISITQRAIEMAENSYQRNLSRIRDGQGLPLEALQSLRAREEAQRAYNNAVIEYNQAQFRLQWSLGWPIDGATS